MCSIQSRMGASTVVSVSSTCMSNIRSASTLYQPLAKILLNHEVKHFKNAPGTTTPAYLYFVGKNKVVSVFFVEC